MIIGKHNNKTKNYDDQVDYRAEIVLGQGVLVAHDINILMSTWASKVGTNTTKTKIKFICPYTYNKSKNKNCVYLAKTNKTLWQCEIYIGDIQCYIISTKS